MRKTSGKKVPGRGKAHGSGNSKELDVVVVLVAFLWTIWLEFIWWILAMIRFEVWVRFEQVEMEGCLEIVDS